MTVIQWFQPHLLARFKKEVEEALYGHMAVNDIVRLVRLGTMRGATAIDGNGDPVGFALYSVVTYPRKNMLRVDVLVGKDLDSWLEPLVEHLKEVCRTLALDGIEFCGRKGFMRKLKTLDNVTELAYAFMEVSWDLEQELQ